LMVSHSHSKNLKRNHLIGWLSKWLVSCFFIRKSPIFENGKDHYNSKNRRCGRFR
jgi:hypothetical protein